MHHRTNAAPSARPRRASSATPSLNGKIAVKRAEASGRILYDASSILESDAAKRHLASLQRTTSPVYQGLTPLDSPARRTASAFDWRAFALLLLAGAIAWLGWVAFTGPAPSATDEPAAAAEVAR